jgi:hypothetical protein
MVTHAAGAVATKAGGGSFAQIADRWIYVFMAALFFVTVLVGFIPDAINMLAEVEAGQRPPLAGFMHFHAVMMGAWILLLLAQSTLMATGKNAQHQKLGLVSVALAPAVVVSMVGIVAATFTGLATVPPGAMPAEALNELKFLVSNLVLEQSRIVLLFPAFVIWALLVRRDDPETHKRLIILATLLPLPAAFDRMTWLPTTMPESPVSIYVYYLLWLSPVLIHDLVRRGRVHRAYVIGIALNLPFIAFSFLSWGSSWWLATAPTVFGIVSW